MRRLQPVTLSSNILDALAEYVQEMSLRPGDRLPSEREISDRLGVSRQGVREALGRWAALGMVETLNGRGTFLRANVAPGTTHLVVRVPDDRETLLRTLELRRALETEAAALAARRATKAQVAELRKLLEAVEVAYERTGDAPEEDWAFHLAVYRAAGNELFLELIQGVVGLFHRFWENPTGRPEFARRGLAHHRRLVEAIARRDPEGARKAVERIIALLEAELQR